MFYHNLYQFRELCLRRIPAKRSFCLCRISKQLFHFTWTEIFTVYLNHCFSRLHINTFLISTFSLPTQFHACFLKSECTEFSYRMHLACCDNEIIRFRLLQNQPHTFHIILGISPVATGIHITKIQLILISLSYTASCQCNLTGNEVFTSSLTFMIKQDSVTAIHVITLTIILHDPESIQFCDRIRTARIERSRLLLWHLLYLTEKFRCRSLIDMARLFQSTNTYSLQQSQYSDCISLSTIFRNIERNLYVTLSS